ncbi:DUF6879 family protein [Actinomadura sp. HBU206391]|uniref:DUF6879 family protein n=1 Tax=Actinomadura sp. HBU206391 TaxID=2731692 RepID=UPI00164F7012|nr:DUF6879 family protein [Actinomadura sp. HBU206391]MBC6456598.1 hypothetical protein [Actinomadura sp. HBU206391]
MLERLLDLRGTELGLDTYLDDFESCFWRVTESWKLERQQTFSEPEVPSWMAMAEGDWATALRLAEDMRPSIKGLQQRLDDHGITQNRVRIVEWPLSPYLWWELHVLRIRAEEGERIRVLDAAAVRPLEEARELPEALVLGGRVAYVIRYDGVGVLDGARKLTDAQTIAACHEEIAALHRQGEDLLSFFPREVARLSPPVV